MPCPDGMFRQMILQRTAEAQADEILSGDVLERVIIQAAFVLAEGCLRFFRIACRRPTGPNDRHA